MIDGNKYDIIRFGRILEFNADCTAKVQISSERVISNAEGNDESVLRTPIEGVPVHTCSGGGWAVTHPIKAGDTCILFFSQEGYDHWYYNDEDSAGLLSGLPKPHTLRQFNQDDGYALVGLNTQPRAIQGYSLEDSEWRNADKKQLISLKKDLSIELSSTVGITVTAPEVTVVASTSVDITSPNVNIDGALAVTGDITSDANIEAGVNLVAASDVSAATATISTDASVGTMSSVVNHQHTSGKPGDPTTPLPA